MTKKRWFLVGRVLVGLSILLAWLMAVIWLIEPLATLTSLKQVDDYPLYTMHYYGPYEKTVSTAQVIGRLLSTNTVDSSEAASQPAWACSLFAALGDPDNRLYGRNFDWQYSPAVLLFTHPPDGYASVSMVDIAYLGFKQTQLGALTDLSLLAQGPLLGAPFMPFDGMNEHGLAVGMAAVPGSKMPYDPDKETIDSLGIIREMLDHARNVDEAVAIMQSYNIVMGGGPPIHYLIADRSGRSVLVEFYNGEMKVLLGEIPWHAATNFLISDEIASHRCPRYARITQRLTETQGQLTTQEAIDLLADVSQSITQWSVVYGMNTGQVNVEMGRQYDDVHTFRLKLVGQ